MSLDLETRLRTFLASAPQNVRSIVVVSISHSAMSRVWHLWREPYVGNVTLETSVEVEVRPCNIVTELAGTESNLDQVFRIAIDTVDIEDTFREELDAIPLLTEEQIQITYREYLSDDLSEPQATATLQAESIAWSRGSAAITAVSPRFNVLRTGRVYTTRDIPMLRGFV